MSDQGEGQTSKGAGRALSGNRLALLLLLYGRGASGDLGEPIEGRTRLQKLMYLLNKEHRVVKSIANLKFEAYAYGPYRPELYDDLAFLKNMGYLTSRETGSLSSDEMQNNVITFDYLMGGLQEDVPEKYETERYQLSRPGFEAVEHYLTGVKEDPKLPSVLAAIQEVKTRFNRMPLRQLLRYVYTKYPEDARESVIADQFR